jgi:short-chain fatty acids transporter
MSFSDRLAAVFQKYLPSPFAIAILLTALTFLLAALFTPPTPDATENHLTQLFFYWYEGLWDGPLLVFLVQMMLMLVLGHALALTKPIDNLLQILAGKCTNTAFAAALVCFLTLLVSFFNWGLGLVFGAIFARKVAENASATNFNINYPLVGAAGYSGLMVWHGGLSGSAPIKVAEKGHFLQGQIGVISMSETIFSFMNISISILLIILLPVAFYILGRNAKNCNPHPTMINSKVEANAIASDANADKIDTSKIISKIFGLLFLIWAFYIAFIKPQEISAAFITPNYINFLLLGCCILLHRHFNSFLSAIDKAIAGASGILIQFPLYFGIMGIMKYSGLAVLFSDFFVSISTPENFPVYTFISAAIVNIFVPSGGGQLAVQGPIIADAIVKLSIPANKAIMALAYGDQLTNMLQPFWALPLLGITGLKAKEILPYSILIMLIGAIVFIGGLIIF